MGGIARALVGLKHKVGPTVGRGQANVRIEKAALAAVGVRYRGVVHIHELREVVGRNDAAVNVSSADLRNDGGRFAGDALVLVLEIESADGAVKIGARVAVIQIEVGGKTNRSQRHGLPVGVHVRGRDVV